MNETPRPEAAELARLLPPPDVPELPADRHRLLKDTVMQEFTEAPRRPRRRLARFAAPVAAVAVAALLIGMLTLGRPAADRTGGGSAPAAPRPAAGPGPFVYVKSKVAWLKSAEGPSTGPKEAGAHPKLDELHDREIWLPQSQGDRGLIREDGETFGLLGAQPNDRYLDLPTDPGALLARIYADTKGQGPNPDYQAFDSIGEILRESILPPELSEALYRAAAEVPGAVLVKDAVDAAGRHGVAVGRTDSGERREWIFDPETFEYLGERGYLVRDTATGKAGMVTATTAVLRRGVVDKAGELPR